MRRSGAVRIPRFCELRPVTAHLVCEVLISSAVFPISRQGVAQQLELLAMIGTQWCPLSGFSVGKVIEICPLSCARRRLRNRAGTIGEHVALQAHILSPDIGVRTNGIDMEF